MNEKVKIVHNHSHSLCNCEVCYRKDMGIRNKRIPNQISDLSQQRIQEGEEICYADLLKYLVSSEKHIKGAPIFISETVVFTNKKISSAYYYSSSHSEFRLLPPPYTYTKILKIILDAQRKRFWSKEHKIFPLAILRLKDSYRLLTKWEFTEFMLERPASRQRVGVKYLQSYILNKYGLSSVFNYTYGVVDFFLLKPLFTKRPVGVFTLKLFFARLS